MTHFQTIRRYYNLCNHLYSYYLNARILTTFLNQSNISEASYINYLNLYVNINVTKSNKPSKSKNNTTKKVKPTKTNSKETNPKVKRDENSIKTTTMTKTTTANDQGVVKKSTGTSSSTMSISGGTAYKEMNLMFIHSFERFLRPISSMRSSKSHFLTSLTRSCGSACQRCPWSSVSSRELHTRRTRVRRRFSG